MPSSVISSSIILTGFAVISIGLLINLYGIFIYRAEPKEPQPTKPPRWIEQWEFSPQSLGEYSYSRLALISAIGLFLELLMIRWVSSEINLFAYFKNFVLVACFLGFGLGCYLSKRRINLTVMLLPLVVLALICELRMRSLRRLVISLPIFINAISNLGIFGTSSLAVWSNARMTVTGHTLLLFVGAILFVVISFGLIALVFIPIGQLVGWYLENSPDGIAGYTVNILGSLGGIALYTLLCFLSQPPAAWFLVAGTMLLWLLWTVRRVRWATLATFLICIGLSSMGPGGDARVYWSPYQKLTLRPVRESGEITAYEVDTDGAWYQRIVNLSPEFVASHPALFGNAPTDLNPYNLPYRFYPQPVSVLVLGAGTGNDVAAALRNGAGQVTAVEIDPLILQLGRQLHFEHPYDSSRVHVVVNDARSYMQNSNEQFDFIVFSLLDSHTTSSSYSNIRIDNYVYTLEALRAARRMLKPDGLMIVKFAVETPWIGGRLQGLLETVFGRTPVYFQAEGPLYGVVAGRFFIAGSQPKIDQALADPALAAYVARNRKVPFEVATLTTDDWPYFYQRAPGLPASVAIVSVVLILLCWGFLRETGTEVRSISWHFFFLGAGFLLLEAQIVSKMALLFGTTWVVNSIVIGGLMVFLVGANLLVEWRPRLPIAVAYVGIFASMLANYAIPLETFFFDSIWIKALAATAVLCIPVFFAGIVFIRSFARERFSAAALGSNLMGALVGGFMESLSMWTGIRSLLMLAALLYAGSWIALRWQEPSEATVPATDTPSTRRAADALT